MSDGGATQIRAEARVVVDDDRVRVTEWRFAPGAAIGWHRHDFDYMVTPMNGGPLDLIGADGTATRIELKPFEFYYRPAGIEHDVVWRGEGELRFIEVEFKRHGPAEGDAGASSAPKRGDAPAARPAAAGAGLSPPAASRAARRPPDWRR